LYLGRASASRRRLLNEHALMAALERWGFTCIPDPGGLDFHEQCRLMAEADVVVAPHGAALSLIFCCAPGTKLLEIQTSSYVSSLYAWMAMVGALQYSAVFAELKPNSALPSMDDLWIDPQVVLDHLADWEFDP
jgi:capsular polysaccharide biosynthesis protein